MKTNTKKRHHYIPRCYSKNFTIANNPKCIFVYEKDKVNSPNLRTPDNIGIIGHYNTFQKANGETDTNTIEDMFGVIEDIWPTLIAKFQERSLLTYEDINNLCTFIALMRIRVPNFRLHYGSPRSENFKTLGLLLAELLLAGKKIANIPIGEIKNDELKKFHDGLINGNINVEVSKQIDLKSLEFLKICTNISCD